MTWSSPIVTPQAEPSQPAVEKKPASIELELPSDARLFVDGQAVPGQGSTRAFSTPDLTAGKTYYYDMSAEITVNGSPVRQELRVVVRGGETWKQSFGELLVKAKAATPTDVAKK